MCLNTVRVLPGVDANFNVQMCKTCIFQWKDFETKFIDGLRVKVDKFWDWEWEISHKFSKWPHCVSVRLNFIILHPQTLSSKFKCTPFSHNSINKYLNLHSCIIENTWHKCSFTCDFNIIQIRVQIILFACQVYENCITSQDCKEGRTFGIEVHFS